MEKNTLDYEAGLRDGKLVSLERAVNTLTADVSKIKMATYSLYGPIALLQILPALKGALG